ncbi:MAG: hypothetical protein JWO58_1008 [Chitinophagaceae bacterium]|nr:hypothetical protein [Chitinophagaceae bacterium]
MRPEFEKYNLIDNYLNGKLPAQEISAFEKELSEDAALREDVFDRKVVNEIIIEKRFYDIATGLRTAPTGVSLLSKSLKRFVGIGAAVTVILFTPYYFSKRAEQAVENTPAPEQQNKASEALTAPSVQENTNTTTLVEEQPQENENIESATEENRTAETETTPVEEKKVIPSKKVVAPVKTKRKAKSYILEIPIDDPSAKGHAANSYTFSVSKGQSWKIPLKNHQKATITIFNKQGDEVYSAELQKDKNTTWKGLSNDGTKQKVGKYAYLLDFGNGDIQHGHVTINP